MIREKYQSIQLETFEVKPGVEFPPEYLAKAQEEVFKQLLDAKIVKEVLRSGDVPGDQAVPIAFLSGTINNYTPGSRSKRYVGFGLGAAEVDAEIVLLDAGRNSGFRRRNCVPSLWAVYSEGAKTKLQTSLREGLYCRPGTC